MVDMKNDTKSQVDAIAKLGLEKTGFVLFIKSFFSVFYFEKKWAKNELRSIIQEYIPKVQGGLALCMEGYWEYEELMRERKMDDSKMLSAREKEEEGWDSAIKHAEEMVKKIDEIGGYSKYFHPIVDPFCYEGIEGRSFTEKEGATELRCKQLLKI